MEVTDASARGVDAMGVALINDEADEAEEEDKHDPLVELAKDIRAKSWVACKSGGYLTRRCNNIPTTK